ncbi:MAG TPA: HEAT repeat domain-containing protein [Pirellulales bacterium]|nr:HEAT repeat domain-containing protein [Pirellulales bacterium]
MADMQQLATELASDDQRKAYRARMALTKLEYSAGGADRSVEPKQLAASIVEVLGAMTEVRDPKKPNEKPRLAATYPSEARNELIRTLAGVGGDAAVPALRKSLDDFDVRDMARWALDRMTAPSASDALAEAAINGVGIEFRIGAINSLGRKPSSATVLDALKRCLDDYDPETRIAAAEALANHVDASHDALIAGALKNHPATRSRLAVRVARARLRLAEGLSARGQTAAARNVYQAVLATAANDPGQEAQKKAAEIALARLG